MELPFIEISVVSTTDKNLSRRDFIAQIFTLFHEKYHHSCEIVEKGEDSFVRVNFTSEKEFFDVYEKPYLLYVHIYEEFIRENLAMAEVFQQPSPSVPLTADEEGGDNYLVLYYRCNNPSPMRQYYIFMSTVYKFFGANIVFEEIQGGFLRFIHTKDDYEILRLPGDMIESWRGTFQIRGIDQSLPAIQRFFSLLEKWKEEGLRTIDNKSKKKIYGSQSEKDPQ